MSNEQQQRGGLTMKKMIATTLVTGALLVGCSGESYDRARANDWVIDQEERDELMERWGAESPDPDAVTAEYLTEVVDEACAGIALTSPEYALSEVPDEAMEFTLDLLKKACRGLL